MGEFPKQQAQDRELSPRVCCGWIRAGVTARATDKSRAGHRQGPGGRVTRAGVGFM